MKIAIGIDIEIVSRFRFLISKKDFYNLGRIFTNSEIEYAMTRPKPESHLAVRFCAKEAAYKALSQFGIHGVPPELIEVICDNTGIQTLHISGLAAHFVTSLSLSHSSDVAIASVILSEKDLS